MDKTLLLLAGLIIIALIAAALHERPASPSALLSAAAATFKQQCIQACAGSPASFALSLPNGTSIYTTEEAICTTYQRKLFCSRCPCALVPGNVTAASSCTLEGAPLLLTCA